MHVRSLSVQCFLIVLFVCGKSIGREIYVPEDYLSIKEAVRVANKGDVIIVKEGTYGESVIVDKAITIRGATPIKPWDDRGESPISRSYKSRFQSALKNGEYFVYQMQENEDELDYEKRVQLSLQKCTVIDGNAMPRPDGMLQIKPLMQIIAKAGEVVIENIIFKNGRGLVLQDPRSASAVEDEGNKNTVGGAVLIRKARVRFKNCSFIENKSTFQGGAVFSVSGSELYFEGGFFYKNESFNGGGVYARESNIRFIPSSLDGSPVVFSSNRAKSFGGGLFLFKSKNLNIKTALFEDNEAGVGGGALYSQGALKGEIASSTLRGNLAFEGGGFYFAPSDRTVIAQDLNTPKRSDPDMPMVTREGNVVSTRSDSVYGGRYELPIKGACVLVAETVQGEEIRACLMLEEEACSNFGGVFEKDQTCEEGIGLRQIARIKELALADVDRDGDVDVRDLTAVWVAFGFRLEKEIQQFEKEIERYSKLELIRDSLSKLIEDKGKTRSVLEGLRESVTPFIPGSLTRLEKVRGLRKVFESETLDLDEIEALEDAIRNILLNRTGMESQVKQEVRLMPWTILDAKDSQILEVNLNMKMKRILEKIKSLGGSVAKMKSDFSIRKFEPGRGVYEEFFNKFKNIYDRFAPINKQ